MDDRNEANPQANLGIHATLGTDAHLHDLERRVHALEDTVAQLDDAQSIEDRVVARVSERIPQAKAAPQETGIVETGILEERIVARLSERLAASASVPEPPPAHLPSQPSAASFAYWGGGWTSWLVIDMVREGRQLVRMFFDRRYAMAWTTRLCVILFLPAMLLGHLWMPIAFFWFPLMWFPWTDGLCIAMVNLVLAFALYKALSREVGRYNERARR